MSMKINRLEIENVKRIKAVKIEPRENGLTLIGGNNNQGKTSVLDSIAWALGGERFKPSQATREGSVIPPNLHIVRAISVAAIIAAVMDFLSILISPFLSTHARSVPRLSVEI